MEPESCDCTGVLLCFYRTHLEDLAQTNGAAADSRIVHAEEVEKGKFSLSE